MSHQGNNHREHWDYPIQFFLSCLGYAVGLGNVWKFPYLCGRSGGAAFLVPYLIMLLVVGLPVFYLELAVGQYAQTTPLIVYGQMAPAFAGVGACMLMSVAYNALTYNVIIAWSLHYLANSFRNPLRWSHCANDFNTFRCFDDILFPECLKRNLTYYHGKCLNEKELVAEEDNIDENWNIVLSERGDNESYEYTKNITDIINVSPQKRVEAKIQEIFAATGRMSPTQEYLYYGMQRLGGGVDIASSSNHVPNWELAMCLLASWSLVVLCLLGGTKTSGRVVYFTATFPYLVLLVLLCRGLTLGPGVKEGLEFYLVPKGDQLARADVWGDAAMQVVISLSLGNGGLTTIASYNRFNANIFRDTLIVTLGDTATSIFAGFVVFPVVGFIAHALKKDVADVAKDGIGLAFQVYPHAINRLSVPQLWSFLFFFMLVTLGIDSQVVFVETIVTAIVDLNPRYRSRKMKCVILVITCTFGCIIGVALTTPCGPYWVSLIGDYGSGWPRVIVCLFQLILVMYVYGYKHFISDIQAMLGFRGSNTIYRLLGYPVNRYWKANWVVLAPALLTGVIIFNIVRFKRSTYNESYVFPLWADLAGCMIMLSCVLFIPIMGLYNTWLYAKAHKPKWDVFKPMDDTCFQKTFPKTTDQESQTENRLRARSNTAPEMKMGRLHSTGNETPGTGRSNTNQCSQCVVAPTGRKRTRNNSECSAGIRAASQASLQREVQELRTATKQLQLDLAVMNLELLRVRAQSVDFGSMNSNSGNHLTAYRDSEESLTTGSKSVSDAATQRWF